MLVVLLGIGLSLFGFTAAAQAAPVRVRCRSSALVAAVNAANAAPGTTLKLAHGCLYRLRAPAVLGDGLPRFTSTTTILGNGATIVRKSSQQFRIIDIGLGADVTISSLTIKGGHAPDGVLGEPGGGIFNQGTLTLTRVTVTRNAAGNTSVFVIAGTSGGVGGGIANFGTLHISRSRIVKNRTGVGPSTPSSGPGGPGGGIYDAGTLEMTRTTVTRNVTAVGGSGAFGGPGGGLYVVSLTPPVISGSVFTRNKAVSGGHGGGIFNASALLITPTATRLVRNRPDNCAPAGTVVGCH
jgi:hypothetical protein